MRNTPLVVGEFYHIYNRGADKRTVFQDEKDYQRFLKSLREFNAIKPIGSIFENSFRKSKKKTDPLVCVVAYCLNPNHYHLILKQVSENGIYKFMQKVGNGYTKYFNERHKRSGVLFQGGFKSVYIESDEQLFYLSSYVNYNYVVHRLGHSMSKSSRDEYEGVIKVEDRMCDASILADKIKNPEKYKNDSIEVVINIREKRKYGDLLFE